MAPRCRRCSTVSIAASRSSASSSSTSTSASRVTRNTCTSTMSMPGKSWSRCAATISSSGTNRSPSGRSVNRGSNGGIFTRANRRSPVTGSRIAAARFSERFEMYGKGCEGSTESGVSTGKMRSRKRRPRNSLSSPDSCSQCTTLMRSFSRAGSRSPEHERVGPLLQGHDPLADRLELLVRRHAVGGRRRDTGLHLLLEAGHPDLEELVEVLAVDRDELDPFEQRAGRVLREREHPRVELEPRELTVEEAGGHVHRGLGEGLGIHADLTWYGSRARTRNGNLSRTSASEASRTLERRQSRYL